MIKKQRNTAGTAAAFTRRDFVVGSVVTGIAGTIIGTAPLGSAQAAPSSSGPFRHAEALSQAALAGDGTRAAGTRGYELSAQYVERVVAPTGLVVYREEFDYEVKEIRKSVCRQQSPVPRDLMTLPVIGVANTPLGGHTAELVQPNDEVGATEESWDGVDARGRIALLRFTGQPDPATGACGPMEPFTVEDAAAKLSNARASKEFTTPASELVRQQLALARARGAIGAIFSSGSWAGLVEVYPVDLTLIPAVCVFDEEADAVRSDMSQGPVIATIELDILDEIRTSFNVHARARNSIPRWMAGAHLDSTPNGPGMNDNASGTAAILETVLAHPSSTDWGFSWWGAEEGGLHGSRHFVNDPVNAATIDNLDGYLNLDMVASPNYVIGVFGFNPDSSNRSGLETVYSQYFDEIGQPWVRLEGGGASDHASFHDVGIPTAGLYTGSSEIKTEAQAAIFGGQAGVPFDPNYHLPADDLANIHQHALSVNTNAQIAATAALLSL